MTLSDLEAETNGSWGQDWDCTHRSTDQDQKVTFNTLQGNSKWQIKICNQQTVKLTEGSLDKSQTLLIIHV